MTEADKWNQIRKAKALLDLSKEEKLPPHLQDQLVGLSVQILQQLVNPSPQTTLFAPAAKETEYPD